MSLLIILSSAFSAWFIVYLGTRLIFTPQKKTSFFGIQIQGILPATLPGLKKELRKMGQESFRQSDFLEKEVAKPEIIQKIIPEIEIHIDRFLQVKLKSAFPLLAPFIGEKTQRQFKETLMSEIELLFPNMLLQYAGKLKTELDVEKGIEKLLESYSTDYINKLVKERVGGMIFKFRLFAAVIGLLIGFVALFIGSLIY